MYLWGAAHNLTHAVAGAGGWVRRCATAMSVSQVRGSLAHPSQSPRTTRAEAGFYGRGSDAVHPA
jgi:hypothetical protein